MTHPVFQDRLRLVTYLAAWLPAGALLAALLVYIGDLAVVPALVFALPVALFYAFVCLAAWFPTRSTPLTTSSAALAALKHLVGAALSSAVAQLVGGAWAGVLARLPAFASVDTVYRQQAPLLFLVGALVYLLAVAACYLMIAVDESRQAEKRALEAEKVQALAARDLELARTIQQHLLPPAEQAGEGWCLAARNQAAQLVAGDFYDYFRLPDGSLMVAIADVSGKGIAASLVTATVKAVLPLLAVEGTVDAILARLNERLCLELTKRTFVALALARFEPDTGRLELANAGLPDPYVVCPEGGVRLLEVPQPRLPLGLRPGIEYQKLESSLAAGDRLLLVTDGLPEAPKENGEPIGYDQLAAFLPNPDGAPVAWLDTLFAALRGATAPELEDDWTAILLERG